MIFVSSFGADNTPYEKVGDEVRDISDEIPFEIPDSWEWIRLGSIVYNRGQISPSIDFCYIDIGSIDNKNQKLNSEEKIIAPDKAPSRARKLVGQGDILYSTVRPYLHNMCIIDRESSHVLIASTGFAVLTCHADLLNKFLFYYMMSPDFDAYVNNTDNAKGVAYPAINDDRLYKALIPIPPLEMQYRIVSSIESVDIPIYNYGIKEETLRTLNTGFPEALKKSILQQAVQGKLVPQDPNDEPASVLLEHIREEKQRLIKEGKLKKDKHESVIFRRDNSHYELVDGIERCIDGEIPFEIPENWAWCRWGALSESIQYGYNAPAQTCGRIRMIRISDIQDNSVMWESVPFCNIEEGEIDTYKLESGDILFARTGGTVGKSYLVQDVPGEAVYAGYLIRTRYSKVLSSKYLRFFMESELYWNQLRAGTIATAQPNCNGKTLSKMLLPVPPAPEQFRIAQKIQELFLICEQL